MWPIPRTVIAGSAIVSLFIVPIIRSAVFRGTALADSTLFDVLYSGVYMYYWNYVIASGVNITAQQCIMGDFLYIK